LTNNSKLRIVKELCNFKQSKKGISESIFWHSLNHAERNGKYGRQEERVAKLGNRPGQKFQGGDKI
jgi:hypothetical protein